MTYTILAYDPAAGQAGVAVVSGSIAVGSRVPWGRHGLGVVATQGYTNPALGPMILELLSKGFAAGDALREALSRDTSPAHRQVAIIDYRGDIAVHDGSWTPAWHGYRASTSDTAVAIANLVTGPGVVEAMIDVFESTRGTLAERLLAAIEAGHRVGGDRRGDRSAALLVVGATEYGVYYDRIIDLRVDYDPRDPIQALVKLYEYYLEH